jgi:hypothetical protein
MTQAIPRDQGKSMIKENLMGAQITRVNHRDQITSAGKSRSETR